MMDRAETRGSLVDRLHLAGYPYDDTNIPLNEFDQERLTALATDKSVKVRRKLASNVMAPVRALELLSQSQDWTIQLNLITNSETPTNSIREILLNANRQREEIFHRALQNPNCPDDILGVYLKRFKTINPQFWAALACTPNGGYHTVLQRQIL